MNRREVFKALAGASAGVAVGAAVSAVSTVVLDTKDVRLGVRVNGDINVRMFYLTLLGKPWPMAGDHVRFDYLKLHLVGIVDETEAESIPNSDRCFYHLHGRVLEFSGEAFRA